MNKLMSAVLQCGGWYGDLMYDGFIFATIISHLQFFFFATPLHCTAAPGSIPQVSSSATLLVDCADGILTLN